MPDELQSTVPAGSAPLSAQEAMQDQVAKFGRWLEGYIDEKGNPVPGLVAMVTEMYKETQLRRERRESIGRALASGGVLAIFGIGATWLKDHLKF